MFFLKTIKNPTVWWGFFMVLGVAQLVTMNSLFKINWSRRRGIGSDMLKPQLGNQAVGGRIVGFGFTNDLGQCKTREVVR